VAQLEPAPDGSGQVLVVTMYIFNSASNSNESGELVYYQPTQSPYAPPYM
jgi:hypothetical protein